MAATEILATGTTAASSSEVTVTDKVTICLKGVINDDARVLLEIEDDTGGWVWTGAELTSANPSQVVITPMTFRATRVAGGRCGVFTA